MFEDKKFYQISGKQLNRLLHLIDILDVNSLYNDQVNNIIDTIAESPWEEEDDDYEIMRIGDYEFELYKPEEVIRWTSLETQLGDRYGDFSKWIRNQTTTSNGAYRWDVERFLNGLSIVD